MSQPLSPDLPELKKGLFQMFREFFGRAEKKRRWSLEEIPWNQANPQVNPAVAAVVESFCVVELFLPDYVAQALPMIRTNRGWSSFHVNWGYEESKHSLALAEWLIRSGARTRGQLTDLEGKVFQKEWVPPQDSGAGMLIYAMCQELATWVHYRNLRQHVNVKDDPALIKVLDLIAIDERAHHNFYRRIVQLFLEVDRAATLEYLRRIFQDFAMPAVHLLADSQVRVAQVRSMNIFTEDIFYSEVYLPILEVLGVSRAELRNRLPNMKGRVAAN